MSSALGRVISYAIATAASLSVLGTCAGRGCLKHDLGPCIGDDLRDRCCLAAAIW